MKKTTIFEISKILNLSVSTVSRALKNHQDIAPHTKAKVLETAKMLDYEPNLLAVSLRKDNSREIAIIAPMLSGFFYESFISAVEAESKKLGYSLITLLSGDDPEVEIQNIKTCRQRRVACIMLCVTSKSTDQTIFHSLNSLDIPIIFFDKVPGYLNSVSVCADDRAAAAMAANALLKKGMYNVFSIFGDLNFSITKNRLKAYLKTFSDSAEKIHLTIVHATTFSEAENLVINAFKNAVRPEAIFCMSDEILIGVMKAIQILKVVVPADVSIIAISNGFFPKLYFPEITYVETSGYKLGKLAMHNFVSLLKKETSINGAILEPVFVPGGSL